MATISSVFLVKELFEISDFHFDETFIDKKSINANLMFEFLAAKVDFSIFREFF